MVIFKKNKQKVQVSQNHIVLLNVALLNKKYM